MLCRLKSCPRCKGDVVLDVDEWRCLQCARYYHLGPVPRQTQTAPAVGEYLNDWRAGDEKAVRLAG